MKSNNWTLYRRAVYFGILLALAGATVAGCSKQRAQQPAKNVKRYKLVGMKAAAVHTWKTSW